MGVPAHILDAIEREYSDPSVGKLAQSLEVLEDRETGLAMRARNFERRGKPVPAWIADGLEAIEDCQRSTLASLRSLRERCDAIAARADG